MKHNTFMNHMKTIITICALNIIYMIVLLVIGNTNIVLAAFGLGVALGISVYIAVCLSLKQLRGITYEV